ncbi:anaerobic ribonucleoside-triphosphate reductase activating protein [Clostridium sp. C105KSO13]|uniref:anaerobic ribonucleoside-triphosphate reductase activating protein n=1 Tax=Clostridium sp. C105KSO13 TaxID=1776045 RepID=UPI0007406E25|nr:anaerobic ribonucleoside-triphosphate reductase activating protein [Clostridium sp. C105KSO13]CUX29822.1 anaerobic ribonucleotide reductase-activating protein [Clostridium sp. C105KSO13]
MNYSEIKKCDIANGEGVRVSLFVSGCTHHCKGCFNEETWSFSYGKPFTEVTQKYIIHLLEPSYINGLSLLGGEPLELENQRALLPFLKKVRLLFPEKDIWCYTGYTLEKDLLGESRARCECTEEMLELIDVLVDGEFKEELKDISLQFRGSSNQRIINVPDTLKSKEIRLWNDDKLQGASL